MTGSDSTSAVVPGSARHVSVLGREVVGYLQPRDGGVYLDGTFGAGGHTRSILKVAGTRVIGIDRDQSAISGGFGLVEQSAGRLVLVEDRFANLDSVARDQGYDAIDGVLLDVGVSSMQLDQGERGFSFRYDGPLDMRMGAEGPSAADVVAHASERDLSFIISTLGEERFARPIARAIVKARAESPIATTERLVSAIGTVLRQRPGEIHPATRTFQALRIFVNDELGELAAALGAAERILKAGGRLAVISFHSLEDRIVKSFFAERGKQGGGSRHAPEVAHAAPSFSVLTRRPVIADEAEIAGNPRARSAKLRVGERTGAPALDTDLAHLLPRLPAMADVLRGR